MSCATLSLSYNHEPYLLDCINGVIAQTYRPLRWILCLDASPDNSLQVIEANRQRILDAGIEFTFINHAENKGMFDSFDDCVAELRNEEYVSTLETDDYFCHPQKIEKSINFLREKGYDAAHSDICSWWPDGRFETHSWQKMGINPHEHTTLEYLLQDNRAYTATLVYNRKAFDSMPPHSKWKDLYPMCDYPSLLSMAMQGYTLGYIKEPMSTYRVLPNSASHRADTYHLFVEGYLRIKHDFNQTYRETELRLLEQ